MASQSSSTLRIAVIGAGASGTAMLSQILQIANNYPDIEIELDIIEKSEVLGSGIYNPYTVTESHWLNVPTPNMALHWADRNEPDMSFFRYLKREEERILQQYDGIDYITEETVAPRREWGAFLAEAFEGMLQEAAQMPNINVNVHTRTAATAMDIEQGTITLEHQDTGQETTIETQLPIVATGHWYKKPSGVFAEHEDLFRSTLWPATELADIVSQNPDMHAIGFLGANLSSVDGLYTVTQEKGEYHRRDDGRLTFVPHDPAEIEGETIYFMSRSGRMSAGLRRGQSGYFPEHIRNRNIMDSMEDHGGHLHFGDMEQMLRDELAHAFPNRDISNWPIDDIMNPLAFYRTLNPAFADHTSNDLFLFEYDIQHHLTQNRGDFDGLPPEAQDYATYLDVVNAFIMVFRQPERFASMQAEDLLQFEEHVASLVNTHSSGALPLASSERVAALMRAGLLEVVELGYGYDMEADTDARKAVIRTADGDALKLDYVVNAVGQSRRIENHPNPLTQQLLDEHAVEPRWVEFSPEYAAQHPDHIDALGQRVRAVETEEGTRYFLNAGGVGLDENRRTIVLNEDGELRPSAAGSLHWIGPDDPLPGTQAMWACVTAAQHAARDIESIIQTMLAEQQLGATALYTQEEVRDLMVHNLGQHAAGHEPPGQENRPIQ